METIDLAIYRRREAVQLVADLLPSWVLHSPNWSAISARLYGRTIDGTHGGRVADAAIQKARKAGTIKQVRRGVWVKS